MDQLQMMTIARAHATSRPLNGKLRYMVCTIDTASADELIPAPLSGGQNPSLFADMPLNSDRITALPGSAGISQPAVRSVPASRDLAKLQALARLMDSAVQIPGTPVHVGLDGVLGLIPGAGDTLSALMSVFILYEARRLGIPRLTLHRMATNVLLDAVVGSIPIAGDVFDVYWKANNRNVDLLRRHLESAASPQASSGKGDWLFFLGLISVLIAIIALGVTLAYVAIRWLFVE